MGLCLDTKHFKGMCPLSIRFRFSQKEMWYFHIGEMVSVEDFNRIMSANYVKGQQGRQGKDAETHHKWEKLFYEYAERVNALSARVALTMNNVKTLLTGMSETSNFLSVWEEIINERKPGTAESYKTAMRNFCKCFGLIGVKKGDIGFAIDASMIHQWVQKMTDDGLAKATIGMNLRACRVVVRECIRRGMIEERNYPFSDKDADLVSIPRGRSRKDECLSVERMTQLYGIFTEKNYPETWDDKRRKDVHESLGLFLFMYLGNGMNLADVARLQYDDYYQQHDGKAIRFERVKTSERSENNSEVIVPVIPELRVVIDETAAPCEKNGLMFPYLLDGARNDVQVMRRIQQENQNIRKRIRCLTEWLGWDEKPSPTWCRHSFATNLIHAGVPQGYVSEAMGHSTGNDITMGYVGRFPLEQQMEYNSRLLVRDGDEKPVEATTDEPVKQDSDTLAAMIQGLSIEEKTKLLKLLLK